MPSPFESFAHEHLSRRRLGGGSLSGSTSCSLFRFIAIIVRHVPFSSLSTIPDNRKSDWALKAQFRLLQDVHVWVHLRLKSTSWACDKLEGNKSFQAQTIKRSRQQLHMEVSIICKCHIIKHPCPPQHSPHQVPETLGSSKRGCNSLGPQRSPLWSQEKGTRRNSCRHQWPTHSGLPSQFRMWSLC